MVEKIENTLTVSAITMLARWSKGFMSIKYRISAPCTLLKSLARFTLIDSGILEILNHIV